MPRSRPWAWTSTRRTWPPRRPCPRLPPWRAGSGAHGPARRLRGVEKNWVCWRSSLGGDQCNASLFTQRRFSALAAALPETAVAGGWGSDPAFDHHLWTNGRWLFRDRLSSCGPPTPNSEEPKIVAIWIVFFPHLS